MFKNCVFKTDVDTVQWAKAAARRAIKTMAQTFVATVGAATVMGDVNWTIRTGRHPVYGHIHSRPARAGYQGRGLKGGSPYISRRGVKRALRYRNL